MHTHAELEILIRQGRLHCACCGRKIHPPRIRYSITAQGKWRARCPKCYDDCRTWQVEHPERGMICYRTGKSPPEYPDDNDND